VSASIRVEQPGILTTVQDRGRSGWEALGIPTAGALDFYAYAWANRLAANPTGAAVLEATLQGPSITPSDDCWIATTGASAVTVDGCAYPSWAGFWVSGGSTVTVGGISGARAYLAVHGGIDVDPVLGSRSTDLTSGFGGYEGRALEGGDTLPVGAAPEAPYGRKERVRHPFPPQGEPEVEVRVVLGPRNDAFSEDALPAFLASTYTVSPQSNRVGLRLDGDALPSPPGGTRISEPMQVGGVQIPPSGRPIVLMNDRGTVGGYPVLATVIAADVWRLAQARPGDTVRFTVVSVRAGEAMTRHRYAELQAIHPVAQLLVPAGEEEAAQEPQGEEAVETIAAPATGIFYRGSKPGGAPLVDGGAAVQPDTVVGVIEVMKTFQEVRAGIWGRIKEIEVADEDVVTEGQTLMTVEPEGR
jgi:antagonist of KipI